MMDAKATIITAMAVTAGTTIVAQVVLKREAPRMRIVVGTGVAGFVLLGLAQASPELARNFAVLIGTTALLVNGEPVASALSRYLTKG